MALGPLYARSLRHDLEPNIFRQCPLKKYEHGGESIRTKSMFKQINSLLNQVLQVYHQLPLDLDRP